MAAPLTVLSSGDTLKVITGAAVSLDWSVACQDQPAGGAAYPVGPATGTGVGNIATATTTTLVAAPSANIVRYVSTLSLTNRGASPQTATVVKDNGTAYFQFPTVTLNAGESLQYTGNSWQKFNAAGDLIVAGGTEGYNGRSVALLKIGTAAEAAGQFYCTSKDSGFPGAWAPGTPGLAGRATDGTQAADSGCIPWQNASVGSIYATQFSMGSTVAHMHFLFDCLWVNTAIAVTTTTSQTINSVAFPARDLHGTVNGEGVMIGILVATATTNAGAVTNTTLNYTNSGGTPGRTATIASFPITAVAGTIMWFQLQAGDRGVQSIQSITLGTSYGGGAISLIAARWIVNAPGVAANIGASAFGMAQEPGVKLFDGTCLLHCYLASATTATTSGGVLTLMEK